MFANISKTTDRIELGVAPFIFSAFSWFLDVNNARIIDRKYTPARIYVNISRTADQIEFGVATFVFFFRVFHNIGSALGRKIHLKMKVKIYIDVIISEILISVKKMY